MVFLNAGGDPILGCGIVLMAAGCKPSTETLNLDKVGFFFHGPIFLGGFCQVFGEDFDLKCRLLFVNRKLFLHRRGFFVGATSGILTVESVKTIESIRIQRVAESIRESIRENIRI
jgi:hypothetical protein